MNYFFYQIQINKDKFFKTISQNKVYKEVSCLTVYEIVILYI